jgi:nickel transport protein
MRFIKCLIAVSIFITITFVKISIAHKLSAFAYREGDKIMGEAYFASGTPCKKCKVEIFDAKGNKIKEGITDQKGEFSLIVKNKEKLKVVVKGGEGHLATFILEPAQSSTQTISEENIKENKTPGEVRTKNLTISSQKLEKVITKAINEKISPKLNLISTQLMDIRKQIDKASIMEIIGGIGYIFGIWGIIVFLKNRKKV